MSNYLNHSNKNFIISSLNWLNIYAIQAAVSDIGVQMSVMQAAVGYAGTCW